MLRLTCLMPLAVLTALLSHSPKLAAAEQSNSLVGKKVEKFRLKDGYGQEHALADVHSDLVVVAFLGTECPLAKLYAPRLESLKQRFAQRGVTFLGINANVQDLPTELVAYAQRHQLTFPILKDLGNRVADVFGAKRTPEVFVLDRDRIVRYHGRIDDQYAVGVQRLEVQREDLAEALEELLAGKPVSVAETKAPGCFIGRVRKTPPQGEITYAEHIAPIFNARCVECHRPGQIAPFSLTSYAAAEGWGDTIAEVIEDERMPPWGASPAHGKFANDTRLSDAEKETILTWIENGMPQGDLSKLPPKPQFAEGWRIPEPDQVVYMDDKPFTVPAEGVVDYQYFEVDPGFTEDKYIWAAEARPDNLAVVHHIIVYIVPPGAEKRNFGKHGIIDGYAPGNQPLVLPEGVARFVPAGSKFLFEMHYTPNGSVQKDRSYVGFKFLPKDQVKKRLFGGAAMNRKFRIPAGESDHEVVAEKTIKHDVMLLSLTPHMHVRGKSFRYKAFYPDGKSEILLDVPRYDFNWQFTYNLAEPKRLPRGTKIFCTAKFDNSEDNPFNPDPNRVVEWGDQSWEEMMIGFYSVVAADKPGK